MVGHVGSAFGEVEDEPAMSYYILMITGDGATDSKMST